jgi:hypothetical protein
MRNKINILLVALSMTFLLTGCVGDIVAAPFKITGAVVNIVTPDIVGDSIAGVGDAADTIIPF